MFEESCYCGSGNVDPTNSFSCDKCKRVFHPGKLKFQSVTEFYRTYHIHLVIRWDIYRISLAIKQSFVSFQNLLKNQDPSYKMDLDLWDCLERVELIL